MPRRYASNDPPHPEQLKAKQRDLRDGFPLLLTLRVHRSISWLRRAEQEDDDLDRAAQGNECERFQLFLAAHVGMDSSNRIYDAIWQRFAHEIRLLLDNKFVFAPFWRHQADELGGAGWGVSFDAAKRAANRALAEKNTAVGLSILFDRLYILRNQIILGGATWDSSANRNQVRDGAAPLGCLLPVFIALMMDHPGAEWAMPMYPVVEG